MNKKYETVIFVSNPFGFGPTGKTIILIEELQKVWKGKIVYAASDLCLETIPVKVKKLIKIEKIDERNAEDLTKVFKKYKNPFIVCTLNKLAIQTAKSLDLRAFFVDSLGWLWHDIPKEYLLADTYYCFNLFQIKDKITKKSNIKLIPPVLGTLPVTKDTKGYSEVIHIGGFKNPFQDSLSFSYLKLLAISLNNFGNLNRKITITGGEEAVAFMKDYMNNNSNFIFKTLKRDEFISAVNNSPHFITTSGLTATLEAFALKTPTSFLPPTNLSQWKILEHLSSLGCANRRIEWNDFINYEVDFDTMTEKEALEVLPKFPEEILKNSKLLNLFKEKIKKFFISVPLNDNQLQFINSTGTNGSEIIIKDLVRYLV